MQTWQEYEAARLAERERARDRVDAARRKVAELELAGVEWPLLSDARGRLYRAELALQAAEQAE